MVRSGGGRKLVTSTVVTGRILQFDHVRGYGFVAADDDGEDVFLHASVFDGDSDELTPGTKMEFRVMAGDRGRKAFAARLIADEPENDLVPPPRLASPPRPIPGPGPGLASRPAPASTVPAPPHPPAPAGTAGVPQAPAKGPAPDDEQMCDVLSSAEFTQELTELLLTSVSSLTGQQVLEVRRSVLESAKKHGWVDM